MTDIEVSSPSINLAMIQAWPGQDARAHAALRQGFALDAIDGPRAVASGAATLIGYGPASWLLLEEPAAEAWPERTEALIAGDAAVTDQTGAYVLRRVSGVSAYEFMAKGAFLDLDPSVFQLGHAANTVIGHVGVTLWRSGEASFDILVFRSFANSFDHWLHVAGAVSSA